MLRHLHYSLSALLLLSAAAPALADVNIYSARHYDRDDELYAAFTEATGIEVNRIEGDSDELIARMQAEGANSPADVFLTVDAGRIWRADEAGLLAAVDSDVLNARIPDYLRHPDGHWFAVSQRARVIFYAKDRVDTPPRSYEELADPAYAGQICIRSSSNVYNQSLLASIIEADGPEAAQDWAEGVRANMAREPQGGDTDQLRGIVSGECDIAVANTYYFVRGLAEDVDGLSGGIDNIGWVFPNQGGRGTHTNIAAAAILKTAPNPEDAVAFLEFLTTDFAQQHFANQNYEYPAVPGVALGQDVAKLGLFVPDTATGVAAYGENAAQAQQIFNTVGWP
ncbi:Fe(3+) ABC transporter substrate-binding protein [Meridianimarinicoccus roseus]|uniref:Fe(3+) ABC transporter substrate-binding protein n=1 Tax=Meridianimarinicoccus roseus TaxID=2072018 RepID=A0A2V2LGX4_9RHOB|nr:extracellular solute-binding protein [Meridianimarinicoccus roseus]PWR03221.1 Fe(3+) ABC transporter substrate-binding protein [Meridianimarinicoccus roseus]